MVYAREFDDIDDGALTFIVSGKLWRNSLIMMDKETGSLWSHVTGECLEGELVGRALTQIPSVQTTWAEWYAAHPGTRVLKKDEEITSSHYESYFADPEKTGLFRSEWLREVMPGKTLVHGVTVGPHAAAVADSSLAVDDAIDLRLGGIPLRIHRDADGGIRALRGDTGEELVVLTSFWFAWSGFHPNTQVVGENVVEE